jgi:hypothetical protein
MHHWVMRRKCRGRGRELRLLKGVGFDAVPRLVGGGRRNGTRGLRG